jgi:hypothetical protein
VKLLLAAGADPTRGPDDASALDCARQGKEFARADWRPADYKPPFAKDFDGVIALPDQALARRQRRN